MAVPVCIPTNSVRGFPFLHTLSSIYCMVLVFERWVLSQFESSLIVEFFSFSPITLIKRLFSSSSLSAIRVILSAYLRLLIFLPAILIPAWDSSSPAFRMIYSACELNKQGDKLQLCRTPFPVLNPSIVPCTALTAQSSLLPHWANDIFCFAVVGLLFRFTSIEYQFY